MLALVSCWNEERGQQNLEAKQKVPSLEPEVAVQWIGVAHASSTGKHDAENTRKKKRSDGRQWRSCSESV